MGRATVAESWSIIECQTMLKVVKHNQLSYQKESEENGIIDDLRWILLQEEYFAFSTGRKNIESIFAF